MESVKQFLSSLTPDQRWGVMMEFFGGGTGDIWPRDLQLPPIGWSGWVDFRVQKLLQLFSFTQPMMPLVWLIVSYFGMAIWDSGLLALTLQTVARSVLCEGVDCDVGKSKANCNSVSFLI